MRGGLLVDAGARDARQPRHDDYAEWAPTRRDRGVRLGDVIP